MNPTQPKASIVDQAIVQGQSQICAAVAKIMEKVQLTGSEVPEYVNAYNFIKAIQGGEIMVVTRDGYSQVAEQLKTLETKVAELESKLTPADKKA